MSDFGVSDPDMQRELNRSNLQQLWRASMDGNLERAGSVYAHDAVLRYPQDGRRFSGQADIAARGQLLPEERLVRSDYIVGDGALWISECETYSRGQPMLLVSVAEMDNGLILRETRYRASVQVGRREA